MDVFHSFGMILISFIVTKNQVVEGDPVYSSSSKFIDAYRSKAFVDKTLMIEKIFDQVETVMITAPRKFGKSTNLDMLSTFLSMHSFEYLFGRYELDDLRSIFEELNIGVQSKYFLNVNFGMYPVLRISLKTSRVINSENMVTDLVKERIHYGYKMHKHLCDSNALSESEREYCNRWCNIDSYRDFGVDEVRLGLKRLTEFVYANFEHRKVVILVDEYDAMITNSILHVDATTLSNIVNFISDVLYEIVIDNPYTKKVVITGITYIAGVSWLGGVKVYKFLEDHPFVDYFGFTEPEVDALFTNLEFNLTLDLNNKAKEKYGGYRAKNGKQLYSPYSVLNFIQNKRVANYWVKYGYTTRLRDTFVVPQIKEKMEALLGGNPLEIDCNKDTTLHDVIDLQNIFHEKGDKCFHPNHEVLFCRLLDLGYITYDDSRITSHTSVKIPNKEIAEILFDDLKEYYISTYHLERRIFKELSCDNYNERFGKALSFTKKRHLFMNIVYKLGTIFQTIFHCLGLVF